MICLRKDTFFRRGSIGVLFRSCSFMETCTPNQKYIAPSLTQEFASCSLFLHPLYHCLAAPLSDPRTKWATAKDGPVRIGPGPTGYPASGGASWPRRGQRLHREDRASAEGRTRRFTAERRPSVESNWCRGVVGEGGVVESRELRESEEVLDCETVRRTVRRGVAFGSAELSENWVRPLRYARKKFFPCSLHKGKIWSYRPFL